MDGARTIASGDSERRRSGCMNAKFGRWYKEAVQRRRTSRTVSKYLLPLSGSWGDDKKRIHIWNLEKEEESS